MKKHKRNHEREEVCIPRYRVLLIFINFNFDFLVWYNGSSEGSPTFGHANANLNIVIIHFFKNYLFIINFAQITSIIN